MSQTIPESVLPPLFARWLEHLLPAGIPEEKKATCGRCAMLAHPGEDRDPAMLHGDDCGSTPESRRSCPPPRPRTSPNSPTKTSPSTAAPSVANSPGTRSAT
ncbi:MAG: hypothetical protein HC860_16815 [Alkalinema sp. RU_4_3]|nr:hypothetical protein [Alkalinema sp. RU_4_3]